MSEIARRRAYELRYLVAVLKLRAVNLDDSVLIAEEYVELAVRALHSAYELDVE